MNQARKDLDDINKEVNGLKELKQKKEEAD
jgi:hypothetical protein